MEELDDWGLSAEELNFLEEDAIKKISERKASSSSASVSVPPSSSSSSSPLPSKASSRMNPPSMSPEQPFLRNSSESRYQKVMIWLFFLFLAFSFTRRGKFHDYAMFSIASLVSWSTKKQKYKFGCPQCYALGAVLVTFCCNSIWKVSRMMNEAGIGGSCDCMICYYFDLFLLAFEFLWCSAWPEWFLCRQGYINVILSVGSPHIHIKWSACLPLWLQTRCCIDYFIYNFFFEFCSIFTWKFSRMLNEGGREGSSNDYSDTNCMIC